MELNEKLNISDSMELSKTKLQYYSGLQRKKIRQREGLFVVEGEKSVSDTIKHFEKEAIIIERGREVPELIKANVNPDNIFVTGEREISKISTLTTPPDIIAIYRMPGEEQLGEIEDKLYLMLDDIRDPGNIGTIIRTAHWFGINTIIASHSTVDIYNPKTIQASMGSISAVKVIYADLVEVMDKNPEVPVYGLFLDGPNIYDADLEDKGFIVMGNEGNGISENISKRITERLTIPPYNSTCHGESLNVAIATAVTLSEFRRRSLRSLK